MSHKGMILHIEPDKIVPAKTIEAAFEKYPSCAGFGVVLKDNGTTDLSADFVSHTTAATLVKTIEAFKDAPVHLYMGNFPANFKDDERQPFNGLKDNNETIALSYVTGGFPGFIKGDHSEHYNFALNFIVPTLAELWANSNKDFVRFKSALSLPMIRMGMTAAAVGPSTISLFLKDGSFVIYNKDQEQIKTDFGWMSDKLEAAKKEEKPPMRNKAGFVRAEAAPPPPPPPAEPPAEPDDDDEPGVTTPATAAAPQEPDDDDEAPNTEVVNNGGDTALPQTGNLKPLPQYCVIRNGNEVWLEVPPELNGNARKKLIQRVAGFLPDGKQADHYGLKYGHWKHEAKTKSAAIRVQPDKLKGFNVLALVDVSQLTKDKPAEGANNLAPVTAKTDGDWTIKPDVIKKIEAHLAHPKVRAILDEHQRRTISPETLSEQSKRQPTFEESFGCSHRETAHWTVDDLVGIGKEDIHALAVYAAGWKLEALHRFSEDDLKQINPPNSPAPSDKKADPVQRRKAGFVG